VLAGQHTAEDGSCTGQDKSDDQRFLGELDAVMITEAGSCPVA
jgi:hypothetical protein